MNIFVENRKKCNESGSTDQPKTDRPGYCAMGIQRNFFLWFFCPCDFNAIGKNNIWQTAVSVSQVEMTGTI